MTNSKKAAPKLKLRVGGVYEDGDGNECHIVSANPYTDHYGMRYEKSGRCDSEWRQHDLIREVGAPAVFVEYDAARALWDALAGGNDG